MADHLDAPGLMPPGGEPSIDITDIYAFQKPTNVNKSILIFNVNPLTLAAAFNHDALYELKIDTNGDARPDIAFRFKFSEFKHKRQRVTVRRATGKQALSAKNKGKVIIKNAPVSFGSDPIITKRGRYRFFAGVRSDPFFFDLVWFLTGLKPRGSEGAPPISDFFVDKNVFGMALEVPNKRLGAKSPIGIWGRTLLPQKEEDDDDEEHDDDDDEEHEEEHEDEFVQIDRMGRPAINTVFNKGPDKTRFNQSQPATDRAGFGDSVIHTLETLGAALGGTGYDEPTATGIMNILLPDILTYDPTSSTGFLNGRKLTDDVIDIELGLVTNGARTTDGVGAHKDLLDKFPFMGTPH